MDSSGNTGLAAKRAKASPPRVKPDVSQAQELHDAIAQRAFQLYEKHGQKVGHDLENWLQAEEEVLAERMDTDFG